MYGDFGVVNYGGLLKEDTYYTLGGCDLNSCDTISVTCTLVGEEPVTVEVENVADEYTTDEFKILKDGTDWIVQAIEETPVSGCNCIVFNYQLTGESPQNLTLFPTGISFGKNKYEFSITGVDYMIFWSTANNSWKLINVLTNIRQAELFQDTTCPFGDYTILLLSSFTSVSITQCTELVTYATLSEDTPCPFGVYTIESGSIFEAFSVAPSGVTNKFLFPLITNATNKTIRWTDLYNGATETEVLTANKLYSINGVRYANGTKVEFLNNSSGVVNTWTFLPQCECTYEPIKVQYLNTYGALITTWFYKANKQEFSVENSEFKRFQNVDSNFYIGKQRQTFNTSAREKITVNSGWVNESYSQVIKDILTSEYNLLNDSFANVESKSIEIQQNINNGLINYQLTFSYSNDYRR
jgi:hypothetical protein